MHIGRCARGGMAEMLAERQAAKAPAEDDKVRFLAFRHTTAFIRSEYNAILEGALCPSVVELNDYWRIKRTGAGAATAVAGNRDGGIGAALGPSVAVR